VSQNTTAKSVSVVFTVGSGKSAVGAGLGVSIGLDNVLTVMCMLFKELVHLPPDQLDLVSQLWISSSLNQAIIK